VKYSDDDTLFIGGIGVVVMMIDIDLLLFIDGEI
jgi:hypothetical protein